MVFVDGSSPQWTHSPAPSSSDVSSGKLELSLREEFPKSAEVVDVKFHPCRELCLFALSDDLIYGYECHPGADPEDCCVLGLSSLSSPSEDIWCHLEMGVCWSVFVGGSVFVGVGGCDSVLPEKCSWRCVWEMRVFVK